MFMRRSRESIVIILPFEVIVCCQYFIIPPPLQLVGCWVCKDSNAVSTAQCMLVCMYKYT